MTQKASKEKQKLGEGRHASEDLFSIAFHASPALYVVIDFDDGRIVEVNKSWLEMYGFSRPEVIGKTGVELGIFPNPENHAAFMKQIRGRGKVTDFQGTVRDRNGDIRDIFTSAETVSIDGQKNILIISQDVTDHKRVERQLLETHQTQRLLAQAVETVDIGIALFDADDKLVFYNSRYLDLMDSIKDIIRPGVSFEEMLRTMVTRQPARGAKEDKEAYIRQRLEHHLKPTDPFLIHRHDDLIIQADERRMPDGSIFVILSDVTERTKAEESALEAQQRLVEAIETLNDGFSLFDADDRLVLCNSRYKEFYPETAEFQIPGTTFEENIRISIMNGHIKEAIGREEEFIQQRLTEHREGVGPIERERSDGRWLLLSERKTGRGELVGIRTDITDLKQREEALRRSEERFRSVFEADLVGILLTTPEKGLITCNDRLCEIMGYTREELAELTWEELTHPDDIAKNLETFNRAMAGEIDSYSMDKRYIRKDGEVIHTHISVRFMRKPDGSPDYVISFQQDITERVKAEEQIRHIFDLGLVGVSFTNPEKQWINFNDRLCEILGYSRQELKGRCWEDLTHPDDLENHVEHFKKSMSGEIEGFSHDKRFIRKDGEIVHASLSARCVRKEDGSPDYFVGLIHDITERVKAEEQVRHIFELGMVGIAISTPDRGLILINDKFCDILGYSREELKNLKWTDFTHPDDLQDQLVINKRMLAGEIDSYTLDKRYIRKDGKIIHISISVRCVRKADGNVDYSIALVHDISKRVNALEALEKARDELELRVYERTRQLESEVEERRRTEQVLREQEERFRRVLDTALAGIITINENGIIQSANSISEKTFGYKPGGLIGKNVKILMPEPDSAKHDGYLSAYRETGKAQIIGQGREVLGQRKDGTVFPISLAVSELQLGDQRLFTGIVQDITDFKRTQADIMVAKVQADSANKAKSEFLASMSHELRTPLNAIIGFSDTMVKEMFGPIDNEKYLDYLTDIHASGRHLLELINDILDVSAIEAGKVELHEEHLNIQELSEQSLRLVRPRAENQGVLLDMQECNGLPALYADERRVKQILINLLTNAVKFTPGGKHVALAAYLDGDGFLVFEVRDEGIGMDADDLEKALSPFGQVDSSLARRFEGSGLGLPLTKSLVELHGGKLSIDSRKGEGTRVQIRFPEERVIRQD